MQSLVWLIAAGVLQPAADPQTRGPAAAPSFAPYHTVLVDGATPVSPFQRPRAVELSDGYYTRLAIHRYASYATIPLFAAEYAIGRSLYNRAPGQGGSSESLRQWHGVVASGIAGLFAVNTVTGVWNLWEGRAVPQGRTRRTLHGVLMIVADAGFVATGMLAPEDDEEGGLGGNTSRRAAHRTVAIAAMSTAVVGDLMMLIWRKK